MSTNADASASDLRVAAARRDVAGVCLQVVLVCLAVIYLVLVVLTVARGVFGVAAALGVAVAAVPPAVVFAVLVRMYPGSARRPLRWASNVIFGREVPPDGWIAPRPTVYPGTPALPATTLPQSQEECPTPSRRQIAAVNAWQAWVSTWCAANLGFQGSPLVMRVRRPRRWRGLPLRSDQVLTPALTAFHEDLLDADLAAVALAAGHDDGWLVLAVLLRIDAGAARELGTDADGGIGRLRAMKALARPSLPAFPGMFDQAFWNPSGSPHGAWGAPTVPRAGVHTAPASRLSVVNRHHNALSRSGARELAASLYRS